MRIKDRHDIPNFSQAVGLLALFTLTGVLTIFATMNTIEVITGFDIPYVNVIRSVNISENSQMIDELGAKSRQNFNEGNFGIPQKIKLPESKKHLDLRKSKIENNIWLAESGTGQVFIDANEKRKIFGSAIIYLRYNTFTTQNLGDVLPNDIINIVTDKGWQLGYRVSDVAEDISELVSIEGADSKITVILVDDRANETYAFQAILAKVGEKI